MKRGFFTSLVFGALIADMGFSQCVGSVHNRVYAIQPAGLTHQNPTTRKQGDLVRAAEEGDAATLESLLREGVDPNAGDMFDRTALQAAASKGRLDIVRKLINAGANVNGNGGVALTCAACSGHLEMMSHLLKNGADINAVERDGTTPLHRAAACNQLESVKLLLDRGAKVNAQRITGATPLMHACWYTDNPDLIRTLIQAGAKLELRDWHGEPAIVHTASEGHVKALQALIDGGAKVDEECERDQTTALHAAAASGRREALEILLRAGANPNVQQQNGWTPLIFAAKAGQPKIREAEYAGIVQALLAHGAKVDVQQEDGWTALMEAAQEGRAEIARILLEAGANPDLKNADGETARTLAAKADRADVLRLLPQ
jgi:ankyrin repeat protein